MKLKIKEYHKSKNLTQQELADKAGCTRQFINMLENNDDINVSGKMLVNIARPLDTTVDDILFAKKVY